MTVKLWRDKHAKDTYMLGTETRRGEMLVWQSLNGEALESMYGPELANAAHYMGDDMLEVELEARVKAPY